jgi:hypothetical protein
MCKSISIIDANLRSKTSEVSQEDNMSFGLKEMVLTGDKPKSCTVHMYWLKSMSLAGILGVWQLNVIYKYSRDDSHPYTTSNSLEFGLHAKSEIGPQNHNCQQHSACKAPECRK